MIEPFLVKYAASRRAGDTTPGYYSSQINMWVINKDGAEIPLIDSQQNQAELSTKTFAEREQDDESKYTTALELFTKTDVVRESDETSPSVTNLFI